VSPSRKRVLEQLPRLSLERELHFAVVLLSLDAPLTISTHIDFMASHHRLTLIYDEPIVREGLRSHLEMGGFVVQTEASALLGLNRSSSQLTDLVVFHWKPELPIFADLMQAHLVPRLAILDSTATILEALATCDDFVCYPFDPLELSVRAKRLCVHLEQPVLIPNDHHRQISVADLRLDTHLGRAWKDNLELNLTRREYELLTVLMFNAGQVLSKQTLLRSAWGSDFTGKPRTVDQHVSQLRAILGDNREDSRYISTVHGRGYVFKVKNQDHPMTLS
jgi:DNA-binding response OmpR family regulator